MTGVEEEVVLLDEAAEAFQRAVTSSHLEIARLAAGKLGGVSRGGAVASRG